MRSIKFLALFFSLVSFQSTQATYSTPQQDSSKTFSFLQRSKKLFFSLIPTFKASPSSIIELSPAKPNLNWWALADAHEQPWAHEWSRLVTHMAQENAKQTRILLTQMMYRKGEHLLSRQQGMSYYEGVAQEVQKSPDFIKEQDEKLNNTLERGVGYVLTHLAKEATVYLESSNTDKGRSSLVDYVQNLANFYQSLEQQKLGLEQDYFDGDLFQESSAYAKGLFEISHLERRADNLPLLKQKIKDLYSNLDGGKLSDLSRDTLTSLNIEIDSPHRRSSWLSSKTAGTGLLLLLTSSSMIQAAAAARPALLEQYCSTSEFNYGTCETAFSAPIGFGTEIASLKSNSFFQDIITNTIIQSDRLNSIIDTRSSLSSMQSEFYGEIITSNTGSFLSGNATMTTYFITSPHLGMQDTPVSSSQYIRARFNTTGYIDSSRQTINSYTRTAPIEPSYYGQIPNSERMILALTDANQTWPFVYGVVVDRPFGGVPTIVREGIISSTNTAAVYPDVLTSTRITNINPNAPLPVQSVDSFLSSLHSGPVAGSDCLNPRSVSQYLDDIGISTAPYFTQTKTCFERPGVSPLACNYELSLNPGFTRALFIYTNQMNGVTTLFRNLLEGPLYTEGTYKAGTGNVLETRMDYTWNPALGTATRSNSTLDMPMSTLIGSLPLNQVEKIALFNPYNTTTGFVIRATQNASGTAFSYYITPGPELCTPSAPGSVSPIAITTPFAPTAIPSGSPLPSTPDSSGLPSTTIVAIVVPVTVGVGLSIFGLVYGLKKNAENKKSKLTDLEGGDGSSRSSSLRSMSKVTKANFDPSAKGIFSGITVEGKLFENRYRLLFKVTKKKFDEITQTADLKMEFEPEKKELAPGKEAKMDLILGDGNFGQVRVAQDAETNEFVAVKIVPGNEKVKESIREGDMQHRLKDVPHVLPLLDRLHYTPDSDGEASAKLLKMAFGTAERQNEDLLLQFTPLASFGDGEALSYRLSLLKDEPLKDKMVTYVAYCFVTGLMGMHHKGVSHLDFKLGNLLLSWKGDVWVADMGCAVQKKMLRGGLGDFRYFSPERLDHLRHKGAIYSGQAADSFAAGLSILELMVDKHPLQALFDQRPQGSTIPIDMVKNWTTAHYHEGLSHALREQTGKIVDVVQGLIALKPEERWTMDQAHKELKKLVPQEKPDVLFTQFLQALLSAPQATPEADQRQVVNPLHFPYVSQGTKKPQETEEKALHYKKALLKESLSAQVYGQDLTVYKEMQTVYQNDQEEEPTDTALSEPSRNALPHRTPSKTTPEV